MNETVSLNPTQSDRVVDNRSGGVNVNSAHDATIGHDVVGRDKIETAGGHIIHAEPGATVFVTEPFRPPRTFWAAWPQRLVPIIGLVIMISAAGLLMLRNGSAPLNPADMVYIPAGSFTMGSDLPDAPADAQPEHLVDLDAYWIDRYEVNNQNYKIFLDATEHKLPRSWEGKYPAGRDHLPVSGISWADAVAYCNFVGKRLPTEAEWEKAARGSDKRRWPWGDVWEAKRANAEARDGTAFTAVGTYPSGASPYNVFDMAGNVWEWVNDWYSPEYYTLQVRRNPNGPGLGDFKVARGGALTDVRWLTQTFTRLGIYPPDFPGNNVGVRCACTDCRQS